MTTVYLDARFALDLAVNYCLLACAARLDGGAVRRRRLALAAGLGAGYGVLTLLPGRGALGHPVGAALAAAVKTGRCGRRAAARLPGGVLELDWDRDSGHIWMTGPAVTVFEGEVD